MAKSTRSKVKRAFRAKKREDGVYAAVEAARLHRLHQKLKMVAAADAEGDVALTDVDAQREDAEDAAGEPQTADAPQGEGMDVDSGAAPSEKRISTHGPRNSRREEWRKSKGLAPRPRSKGMNRQGLPAAKRKSGRSHRRR